MSFDENGETEGLVRIHDQEAKPIFRERKKAYHFKSVKKSEVDVYLDKGWKIEKEYKASYRIAAQKDPEEVFKNKIWVLMAEMGFKFLNSEKEFSFNVNKGAGNLKSADIFAKDDETVLVIDCMSISGSPQESGFASEIDEIKKHRAEINRIIKTRFGGAKLNVAYVFATENYFLSETDKKEMASSKIHHFDEESYEYYLDLVKHLGTAARYQLEANFFSNQTIHNLNNKIPAIQGRMGGHTYYAFSIEPEKLLKMGYVLHRNKANIKLMPTYQRLIKKSRIRKIRQFVEGKGFFPNAIVCSIEASGNNISFEPANTQVKDSLSKVGILHLPKKYRSMYIIDGQHRLYGYSDTAYSSSNTIPVVAFMKLERSQQVQLFMEINENQKSVPKNLRLTLESDLNWDSEDLGKSVNALKSEMAARLGEELSSPLYNRVIVGENAKSDTRTVSLKSIIDGINATNFLGAYSGKKVLKQGTFYLGGNSETYDVLFPFICKAFGAIKEAIPEEWHKGSSEDGLLVTPMGVTAFIRVVGDIIEHLIAARKLPSKIDSADAAFSELEAFLAPVADFFSSLSLAERAQIKKSYGSGGPARLARLLQKAINKEMPEFLPGGMEEYWENESKKFNTQSFEMIRDIESFMKSDFEKKLADSYGESWMKLGLPKQLFQDLHQSAAEKNYSLSNGEPEKTPWDCLHLIDYKKIAEYGSNWSTIFQKDYTLPGDEQKKKSEKTAWMEKLNRIRNENFHEYSVKADEFNFITKVHAFLLGKS